MQGESMAPLTIFAVALICAAVMMVGTTGSLTGGRPAFDMPAEDAALLVRVPLDAVTAMASPFVRLLADARDTLADVRRDVQKVGHVLSPARR